MNYEPDETDYIGTAYPQPQKKQQYIKIGVAIVSVVILIAVAFTLGYVASMYIHGDDSTDGTDTPTDSTSPTTTSSPTPTPGLNNDNWDINQKYYSEVDKHPFSIYDLVRTDRINEPVAAPDGSQFVFSRYVYNPETNKTSTTLWLRSVNSDATDSTNQIPLTPFGWGISEANPCWSLDGTSVLFISNRDPQNMYYPGETSQVWQVKVPSDYSATVDAPEVVTSYPMSVNNLRCSPERGFLAVGMNIIPGKTLQETADTIKQAESGSLRAYTFDKLMIRHWGEWFHGERAHPFIQAISWDAETGKVSTLGTPVDVLDGVDADAPTKPFGGIEEWNFCPHDCQFAFTRRYDETSQVAWTTNLDIFLVQISLEDNQAVVGSLSDSITVSNVATDTQPSYSPDNKWIAYLSTTVPGYEADQYVIRLYDRSTKELSDVIVNWIYSIDSFVWDLSSEGFYVSVGIEARSRIYYVSLTNPEPTPVLSQGASSAFNVLPDGSLLFAWNSMSNPANIYQIQTTGDAPQPTQLTNFNNDMLSKVYLSTPEAFSFTGADNEPVWGWVMKATEGSAGTDPRPVAFLIHGGPQSDWGDSWSYRWNPQTYAGHGYAVVMINFHGSTSYGQAFTDSIQNDYGGKPFQDLNIGLDYAIEKYDFIDGTRQVALGASYGGWMINWINGHNWTLPGDTEPSARFKCLVCHDGIFDQRILYFDTEELWFPEHDMMGPPWGETAKNYDTWNPSANVEDWWTPTLIIHGGRDYRIPDTHGINSFTALQRRGVQSKFAYFPTENHWVLRPADSIYWHETVQAWIDSFTQ
jgi:dipeptidyl aminopeptidase/acylaminoacyl peptidase